MDGGGPFRVPQPAPERRPASRPEPVRRPVEEPRQPINEEPKAMHQSFTSHHRPTKESKSHRRFVLPIVIAVVVLALIVGGLFWWLGGRNNTASAIDGGKYQAVFFTNGQVYFGKLQSFNDNYMKLTDVFYLQTKNANSSSNNPQQSSGSDASTDVQLIKLGNEIHGPEDEMVISKDQVLFFENLKSDGKVATSIDQYNKANNK
ncbi:MAG TPA: hypothetical protein VN081_02650 [Dongiaceae bacterium]|nr:hypothetical protein [Dongiaceae bacterium]